MGFFRNDASEIRCRTLCTGIGLGLALGLAGAAHADSFDRATHYIEKGKYETAAPHLRRGARKGDMRCQFLLGMWSLAGIVVEQDLSEGAAWLDKAAEQGLPIAQTYLGLAYANGMGVERDPARAATWLRKAADYGDPMGQAALGTAAYLGNGVPQDHVEAYKWTKLAADQGNERAAEHLVAIERELNEEELAEATRRAEAFIPSTPPGLARIDLNVKLFDSSTYLRHSTSYGRN